MIEQHIPDELPNDRSDTRSDARVDDRPQYGTVPHVPGLIPPEEYGRHPQGRPVRVSISADGTGVRLPGDAVRPELLGRPPEPLGPDDIEQMLCG